ncbi:MAG: ABC transporter ATP-binding protein [Flavobacteriales bacterium]|nr:ABC transporter ATP-binding protein [Flavobacteriales bacterium]MCB9447494.1 ABC transporter ATP-binding protein [Flavobacteriales bacterium]
MEIITTQHLTKTYDEGPVPVHAVNDVSLSISEGEFTAIVGPSGSGKTTLLNLLGGLDKATSGSVIIGGTQLENLSENELIRFRLNNIGFVFQAYNLIPVLTARENAEFTMLLQNRPKKERQERVDVLLKEVGLEDQGYKVPGALSGGQQQRVAVARALAPKPRFVLADEPTANLDSHSAENLLNIMARLNKEEKTTFIFSTHDQRVIDQARRVITLVDGKVVSDEVR